MKTATLVVATHNRGKLQEFRTLLSPAQLRILSLDDLLIRNDHAETGASFAENARTKAVEYSRQTEHPVLADDSGLEVAALGGRPGIRSARYGRPGANDRDRIGQLLLELERTSGERQARFVCALALAHKGALIIETEGECRGEIALEPRGANGFGYDPIFLFPELGRTYAELKPAEKNRVSHRARAVASLLKRLESLDLFAT
jgi:XTP/dITP diphosphohydrolase